MVMIKKVWADQEPILEIELMRLPVNWLIQRENEWWKKWIIVDYNLHGLIILSLRKDFI